MSATIGADGVFAARIDDALKWRVVAEDPKLEASIEESLNREFGLSWVARFGEYVPDRAAAIAQDAAETLGVDLLQVDAPPPGGENAIY